MIWIVRAVCIPQVRTIFQQILGVFFALVSSANFLHVHSTKHVWCVTTLRMADGSLVPLSGLWTGTFEWGPARVETSFEVFPSGGSWQMLVGKPLLEQTRAIQEYRTDTILLPVQDRHVRIENYKPPWTVSPVLVPSTLFSPGRVQNNTPFKPSASVTHQTGLVQ